MFDTSTLHLGDLEILETGLGVSLQDIADINISTDDQGSPTTMPPARVMVAIGWLMLKSDNPAATLDEARAMSLDDITARLADDTEEAAGE